MRQSDWKIVAPICEPDELSTLIDAGADEFYLGVMFDAWAAKFGESDVLSRRQGRVCHVRTPNALSRIARESRERGCPASLALNVKYTAPQEAAVLDLAQRWEDAGGTALLVADLGILLALAERRSTLERHLSIMAGTLNSHTAAFFADLGITRIVLPRCLTTAEMGSLIRAAPDMAYEAIVLHQKCEFIDAFCGFYHGRSFPDGYAADFDYEDSDGQPTLWVDDLAYEGHGCKVAFETNDGTVRHVPMDETSPPCAACILPSLATAGVRYLKLAGRGFPTETIARSVRFLRRAIDRWAAEPNADAVRASIRADYAETFGAPCRSERCYYEPEDAR